MEPDVRMQSQSSSESTLMQLHQYAYDHVPNNVKGSITDDLLYELDYEMGLIDSKNRVVVTRIDDYIKNNYVNELMQRLSPGFNVGREEPRPKQGKPARAAQGKKPSKTAPVKQRPQNKPVADKGKGKAKMELDVPMSSAAAAAAAAVVAARDAHGRTRRSQGALATSVADLTHELEKTSQNIEALRREADDTMDDKQKTIIEGHITKALEKQARMQAQLAGLQSQLAEAQAAPVRQAVPKQSKKGKRTKFAERERPSAPTSSSDSSSSSKGSSDSRDKRRKMPKARASPKSQIDALNNEKNLRVKHYQIMRDSLKHQDKLLKAGIVADSIYIYKKEFVDGVATQAETSPENLVKYGLAWTARMIDQTETYYALQIATLKLQHATTLKETSALQAKIVKYRNDLEQLRTAPISIQKTSPNPADDLAAMLGALPGVGNADRQ